jgi:hypothetical protein
MKFTFGRDRLLSRRRAKKESRAGSPFACKRDYGAAAAEAREGARCTTRPGVIGGTLIATSEDGTRPAPAQVGKSAQDNADDHAILPSLQCRKAADAAALVA